NGDTAREQGVRWRWSAIILQGTEVELRWRHLHKIGVERRPGAVGVEVLPQCRKRAARTGAIAARATVGDNRVLDRQIGAIEYAAAKRRGTATRIKRQCRAIDGRRGGVKNAAAVIPGGVA